MNMVFFRETYHTKEFFFYGNDLIVRHVEKSIDFRGSEFENDVCQWYKVKENTQNLIKFSKKESDKFENEYQTNKDNWNDNRKKNGSI